MKKQWRITHATTLITTRMHPNEHHVLYIVMDETTKFTWHMCHEPQFFVWKKPHFLVVKWNKLDWKIILNSH